MASECLFPYATEEHGASIINSLKQHGEFADRSVNAKSLPTHIIRSLIALKMYRTVFLSNFGFPNARYELAKLDAREIQTWIDEYITSHNLPR